MTNHLTLVVAASLLIVGAMAPAKAADLGGGCCADLEERVAELEATAARKGNLVVLLQIYGQVNKALMYWDDGLNSDVYVVDNTLASSRFGFFGTANITPGLTAGYNMEFELVDNRADEVYDPDPRLPHGPIAEEGLRLRKNYWYLESDKLGRISLGHLNAASDGASEVVLSNSLRNADPNIGSAIGIVSRVRVTTPMGTTENVGIGGQLNASTKQRAWGRYAIGYQWAEDFTTDCVVEGGIRYDSPSVYGFILSASMDDDDFADVALRFRNEFGSLRVAAAIAYQWDRRSRLVGEFQGQHVNFKSENIAGSASVKHIPTGLYGAFAAGQRNFEEDRYSDSTFWYVQAGIERKLLPFGATTIYGEYGNYSSYYMPALAVDMNTGATIWTNSEAIRWGFGVNQRIDSAAMDIYVHATFWSFDTDLPDTVTLDNTTYTNLGYNDLTTVVVGTRIRF